jgi:hypothetical protein
MRLMRNGFAAGLSIVGLGLISSVGFAASDAETKPAWPKFGYELRTGMTHDDKGFQKVEGAADPSSALGMNIERAKLSLDGEVSSNISYYIRLNLNATANALDLLMLNAKMTDNFSIGLGRNKTLIDGFENIYLNNDYVASVIPYLTGKTVIAPAVSANVIELHYKLAGLIKLQMTDDTLMVKDATGRKSGGYYTEVSKQPAMNLQWIGEFGSLKPLIQYGTYDTNHSNHYSLGFAFKQENILAWVNYATDNQVSKNAAGEEETDARSNISFHAEYQIGSYRPFVRGMIFDVKQDGTDLKANSSATVKDLAGEIDDNLTNYTAGAFYTGWGESFKPYLGYVGHQAKFYEDLSAGSAETVSKTQTMIKLGVISKF